MASNRDILLVLVLVAIGLGAGWPLLQNSDFSPWASGSILQKVICKIAAPAQPTIICTNANDTVTFVGLNGISITTNATTKTVFWNGTANTVNFTFNNVGAGSGVFKNKSGLNVNFRSIIGSGGITTAQNTNDITLALANIPKTTIAPSGQFPWNNVSKTGSILNDIGAPTSTYDFGGQSLKNVNQLNATKVFQNGIQDINTLTAGTAISISGSGNSRTISSSALTSALISLNGDNSAAQTIQGTTNHIKVTDSGATHTIDVAFKVNNVTCPSDWVNGFNNKTGVFTCAMGAGGTTVNSFTGIVNLVRQVGNTTISNSSNTVTVGLGVNPVIVGGADQPITKAVFTINNLKFGGNVNANNFKINNLNNATSKNDAVNARNLGLIGNLTLNKCTDQQLLKYQLSNQTWICENDLGGSTGGVNLGPSQGAVFAGKSGSNLQFKGLNGTNGITILNGTNTITINGSGTTKTSYPALYVIYRSGSTYYEKNSTNSVLLSSTVPETVIQDAINRQGETYITAGTYTMSGAFSGLTMIYGSTVKMDYQTFLMVPNNYNGSAFTFGTSNTTSVGFATISGGQIMEVVPSGGHAKSKWTAIKIQSEGSGVFSNTVDHIKITYPKVGILFIGTQGQWANGNMFDNVAIYNYNRGIEFNYTANTVGAFGFNTNHFNDISLQAWNATTNCLNNIEHDSNIFNNIQCYDLQLGNGATGTIIGYNGTNTRLVGGYVATHGFINHGKNTTKIDAYGYNIGQQVEMNGTNLNNVGQLKFKNSQGGSNNPILASNSATTKLTVTGVLELNGQLQMFPSKDVELTHTSHMAFDGEDLQFQQTNFFASPSNGNVTVTVGNHTEKFQNKTGTIALLSDVTGQGYLTAAITSLDGDTTAAQLLRANSLPSNLTITDSGATHTFGLGQSVLVKNGTDQEVTKSTFTIDNLKLGGNLNWNNQQLTYLGHSITLPSNTGTALLTNGSLASLTGNLNSNGGTFTGTCSGCTISGTTAGSPTTSGTWTFNNGILVPSIATGGHVSNTPANSGTLIDSNGTFTGTVSGAILSGTLTGTPSFTGTLDLKNTGSIIIGTQKLIIRNTASSFTSLIDGNAQTQNSTIKLPITDATSGATDTLMSLNVFGTVGRKDLLDNSVEVRAQSDSTKDFKWLLSGMTTGKALTVRVNQTTSQGINIPNIRETETFAVNPQTNFTQPANQTAISSQAIVMYGGYATITPQVTGNLDISVRATASDSTLSAGCRVDIRFSTSNMGTNGAAAAGTVIGNNVKLNVPVTGDIIEYSDRVFKTGLTVGTKYFIDLGVASITGGSCTLNNPSWAIREY